MGADQVDGSGNSVGLIATVVNAESEATQVNDYDNATNKFRLLTSENGVGKVWSFAYNQNTTDSYGTPDALTTPEGNITNLKVDIRGRTYEATDPSGNAVTPPP